MRDGHLFRCVAVLLVAGFAVVSCSDPVPPAKVSRPSASTTPTSSSPSPTPSTPEQEVEAAVRAYYAELTRAAQTNDTSRLRGLMTDTCPCFGTVRAVEAAKKKGHRTRGIRIRLQSVKVRDVIRGTAAAEVLYDVNGYDVVKADGSVMNRVPPRQDHLDLSLTQIRGRWVVSNVFDLEGG
jgi:hypothetical protein